MGDGRVRGGRRDGREAQGVDCDRAYSERASGHGRVHDVAEDVCDGCEGGVCAVEAAVLVAEVRAHGKHRLAELNEDYVGSILRTWSAAVLRPYTKSAVRNPGVNVSG